MRETLDSISAHSTHTHTHTHTHTQRQRERERERETETEREKMVNWDSTVQDGRAGKSSIARMAHLVTVLVYKHALFF
jgi:hypothetical protein